MVIYYAPLNYHEQVISVVNSISTATFVHVDLWMSCSGVIFAIVSFRAVAHYVQKRLIELSLWIY